MRENSSITLALSEAARLRAMDEGAKQVEHVYATNGDLRRIEKELMRVQKGAPSDILMRLVADGATGESSLFQLVAKAIEEVRVKHE